MSDALLGDLKEIYRSGKLVPFIGAGFSLPFEIPAWGTLIKDYSNSVDFLKETETIKKLIDLELNDKEYWEALRYIKRYANRTDSDIQNHKGVMRCLVIFLKV